ncbi:hypothetical protein PsorP6_019123 [Peronosclerospora sorghi]|nr:hypothetical protein PsorP6_019123 [Peronosclerospora sorghi]
MSVACVKELDLHGVEPLRRDGEEHEPRRGDARSSHQSSDVEGKEGIRLMRKTLGPMVSGTGRKLIQYKHKNKLRSGGVVYREFKGVLSDSVENGSARLGFGSKP